MTDPTHLDPWLELRSSRLTVRLARPGTLYRGVRFDWSTFVTQVTLDGEYPFCTSEDPGGTDGAGLCGEFGIWTAVGYESAAPGDWFVKPGVGLLQRPDGGKYFPWNPMPLRPYPVRQTLQESDRVEFVSEPLECRGYALRLTRRHTVCEDRMLLETTLENVGTQPITCEEYNHNFLALGGRETGPGLTLTAGVPLKHIPSRTAESVRAMPRGWELASIPTPHLHTTAHVPAAGMANPSDWWWELADAASGLRVREFTSVPWQRMALFGTRRLLSPEAFVGIHVPPGETLRWARQWTFGRGPVS